MRPILGYILNSELNVLTAVKHCDPVLTLGVFFIDIPMESVFDHNDS